MRCELYIRPRSNGELDWCWFEGLLYVVLQCNDDTLVLFACRAYQG